MIMVSRLQLLYQRRRQKSSVLKKGKKGKGASRVASSKVSKSPKKGSRGRERVARSAHHTEKAKSGEAALPRHRGRGGRKHALGVQERDKARRRVALAHLDSLRRGLYTASSPASGEAYIPVYGKRKLTSEERTRGKP